MSTDSAAADGLKAVLFDAVNTVLYPDPPVAVAYHRVGLRHGSRLSEKVVQDRFRIAFRRQETLDLEIGRGRTDENRERRRWRAIVEEVFDDVSDLEGIFQTLWRHFADADNWGIFDDVTPIWRELSRRGLTLGLASNFDSRLELVCRAHEPLRDCRHVFVSSRLKARKPHPNFFQAIQQSLGLQPHEVLLVGDNLENDYQAAKMAGWHAVLLQRDGQPFPQGVAGIRGLMDLVDLIEGPFPCGNFSDVAKIV